MYHGSPNWKERILSKIGGCENIALNIDLNTYCKLRFWETTTLKTDSLVLRTFFSSGNMFRCRGMQRHVLLWDLFTDFKVFCPGIAGLKFNFVQTLSIVKESLQNDCVWQWWQMIGKMTWSFTSRFLRSTYIFDPVFFIGVVWVNRYHLSALLHTSIYFVCTCGSNNNCPILFNGAKLNHTYLK